MANDRSPWPSVRFKSAGMRTAAAARLTHLSGYSTLRWRQAACVCCLSDSCCPSTPWKCTSPPLVTAQINNRHIAQQKQQQTLVFVWRRRDYILPWRRRRCEQECFFLQGPDNMHHITTRKNVFPLVAPRRAGLETMHLGGEAKNTIYGARPGASNLYNYISASLLPLMRLRPPSKHGRHSLGLGKVKPQLLYGLGSSNFFYKYDNLFN